LKDENLNRPATGRGLEPELLTYLGPSQLALLLRLLLPSCKMMVGSRKESTIKEFLENGKRD
jgi:hypothetical protein